MHPPRTELLTARDLRAALLAFGDVADGCSGAAGFADAGLSTLARLVPGELTTLSRCDLASGRRTVFGRAAGAIGAAERAAFDRHFRTHPLVRYHALQRGPYAHRISDSIAPARFRESALFDEYYRRIGIDHALALPVACDDGELVSFVFNRRRRDFDDRELALLDLLRRPLARLFAGVRAAERPSAARWGLTPREAEVMQWVAAGKTDREVATLVGCAVRTVHKHLQHAYAKLGVETRTAAAMRLAGR